MLYKVFKDAGIHIYCFRSEIVLLYRLLISKKIFAFETEILHFLQFLQPQLTAFDVKHTLGNDSNTLQCNVVTVYVCCIKSSKMQAFIFIVSEAKSSSCIGSSYQRKYLLLKQKYCIFYNSFSHS